jgi:tol-pal system protein YbgF
MKRLSGRLRLTLVPVAVLATGACFATTKDMRVLQSDLQVVRAEMTAGDSATRAALDAALAQVATLLQQVSDTVKAANATTMRLRGDVREDLQAIRQQLINIQELTGQSQQRIRELRAEMETRANELNQPVVRPPGDTTSAAAPTQSAAPGPAQLYQLGQDQLRRNSFSAARGAYTRLLTEYPTSDLAPDALYGVAETWWADGNGQAADSVYALVVQRYPRSQRAPTALYKRATIMRTAGQVPQARALFQQIVDKYPQSEAALLAADFLRAKP